MKKMTSPDIAIPILEAPLLWGQIMCYEGQDCWQEDHNHPKTVKLAESITRVKIDSPSGVDLDTVECQNELFVCLYGSEPTT